MGLVTGMLWANYTWGAPWSNDIKQLDDSGGTADLYGLLYPAPLVRRAGERRKAIGGVQHFRIRFAHSFALHRATNVCQLAPRFGRVALLLAARI
jgi:hypothetical protein